MQKEEWKEIRGIVYQYSRKKRLFLLTLRKFILIFKRIISTKIPEKDISLDYYSENQYNFPMLQ